MATRHANRDSATGRLVPIHGLAQTDTYHSWEAMVSRCRNPRHRSFSRYGAKGVVVCELWRESFAAFLADVGPRPSREHSLDRFPDRNGNYEPGNVRWATDKQQNRNKDNNRLLTFRGETLCVSEWAERTGVSKYSIFNRLRRSWSVERILTTKQRGYKNKAV